MNSNSWIKIAKCLILAVYLLAVSCNNEIKLTLTDNLVNEIENLQNKYNIILYIDISDCTSCELQNLSPWTMYKQVLKKYETDLLLVIFHPDKQYIMEILQTVGDFNCVFDVLGQLKSANSRVFASVKDNIFVIDRNKNVIFTESPIKDEKTWKKFIKRIGK
jgi:hypothetical protein